MVHQIANNFDPTQLTSCDREPIHIPGSIQPHGALLAFDRNDRRIVHAGGDTAGLLGAQVGELPGTTVDRWLGPEPLRQLQLLLDPDRVLTRPLQAFTINARVGEAIVDVVAHQSADLMVLEFEPRLEPAPENSLALVQSMIRHVQRAATVQMFCEAVATEVRTVSGFDRVMVYQFMDDGSGQVKAESRGHDVESFLGLRYPESDIPKQARALYLSNWIRAIPDARYSPSPVVPTLNPTNAAPLDLSQSVIRSVSPVHCQYLANMGVIASMSLSIIVEGKLWGLIACHHRSPRYLPYRLREACELFAEMASSQLESKQSAEHFAARLQSTSTHEGLVARMSRESELETGLIRSHPNLLDLISAAGVALWIDGHFTGLGETPDRDQVAALVLWLNATVNDGVFHTDTLPLLYPPAEQFADVACGLLALSVSTTPRDYVLWFRPEVVRTVTWAGNPQKPVEVSADGELLTPRKSFAAWKQSVRLHATPWLTPEIEAAHGLRLSLLEVVLMRIDQIARERAAARLLQEKLMGELELSLQRWQEAAQTLKLETERRAAAEEDLSQVLRRTVEDQEAERLRIARELHDTLGQSLTLLQLGLDGIGQNAADNELQQRITAIKSLATDVGREVNRLAWEIRPTALDDLGIQNAVQNLLDTWSESSKLKFDLHLALGDRRLPATIESTLYRVLQEALTNIARHAEAAHVSVILRHADNDVAMIVEDDGHGFGWNDGDAKPPGRLGLLGIRERLALVGGSLEIETAPGQGATLYVRIPV